MEQGQRGAALQPSVQIVARTVPEIAQALGEPLIGWDVIRKG